MRINKYQRQKAIDKIEKMVKDGIKSGMLTLTGNYRWKKTKNYNTCMVEVLCDCGNTKYAILTNFSQGTIKTCGCRTRELMREAKLGNRKHTNYKHFAPYFLRQIKRHLTRGNNRKLEFNLTVKDLDELYENQEGYCYYSGRYLMLPDFSLGHKYQQSDYDVSVDRIDANKGYTKENCVLCIRQINQMKMDLTVQEFYNLCNDVSNNLVV